MIPGTEIVKCVDDVISVYLPDGVIGRYGDLTLGWVWSDFGTRPTLEKEAEKLSASCNTTATWKLAYSLVGGGLSWVKQ